MRLEDVIHSFKRVAINNIPWEDLSFLIYSCPTVFGCDPKMKNNCVQNDNNYTFVSLEFFNGRLFRQANEGFFSITKKYRKDRDDEFIIFEWIDLKPKLEKF